jgi:tRNA A37 methylthiotransferase MiaB
MAKKILFIEPPFYRLFKNTYTLERYPLSLGYLAAEVLKKTDWDAKVYNADFFSNGELPKVSYLAGTGFGNYLNNLKDASASIWREIKAAILEYSPSVVGISAKASNFASACKVAKLAKDIDKNIFVIVGGPHPSMVGRDVLQCPEIDLCVKGEGEIAIVELLNAIGSQRALDSIKGIAFRKNNLVVENNPREFVKDLDSLSFPCSCAPQALKEYDRYPKSAFGYIFATRGCPYDCFFCGSRNIWGREVRFRSPENVIKEIKFLQEQGIRLFYFVDDNFGVNKQYLSDLCNALIKHCPEIRWNCEFHVKLVDEGVVSLMKKAGCFLIQLGIESGNNEILKKMRKHITIEEAFSAARIVKKSGIALQAFFIIGFPQETEETLHDTVIAMKKINCDVLTYSIFTPYPGTESFAFCKDNGLIGENYDSSLYSHQSPANHFCMNIPADRFRKLAAKIEIMVDRKNCINRIKRVFSLTTLYMIQERGIIGSFQKGYRVLSGK